MITVIFGFIWFYVLVVLQDLFFLCLLQLKQVLEKILYLFLFFSLLCCIILFIAFLLFLTSYSYSSYVIASTNDYTYISKIDVLKEDYKVTEYRLNKQQIYFDRARITSYISFIFAIGTIEEIFRTDMLNKRFYYESGDWDDYDSTKYIIFTIEAIVEFILTIILKCLEYFNKRKK